MSEPQTAAEWETFFDQRDAARAAYDRMACVAMQGNDALAAAVRANWEPIIAFNQERFNHDRTEERQDEYREQWCGIVN
jgi:hypothetical protein